MFVDFPIPQPGQSLSVSFAKANPRQRQAVISLLIMAHATQFPLVETRKPGSDTYFLSVEQTSLPAILASELGVSLEEAHNLCSQGPSAVFTLLRSLPLDGRKLALALALFVIAPDSPELLSPLTTKLMIGWGMETQIMPNDIMPLMVQYGEQILRFLTGKAYTSN